MLFLPIVGTNCPASHPFPLNDKKSCCSQMIKVDDTGVDTRWVVGVPLVAKIMPTVICLHSVVKLVSSPFSLEL